MANLINSSSHFDVRRGSEYCRGCSSKLLFSGIDLGNLPLANELTLTYQKDVDKFPLHLKICEACGLGQVADVTTPERIFRNYRYLSSVSSTFSQHSLNFVEDILNRKILQNEDWVLEIASNDGYLLRHFVERGIKCIGVEPAKNVAEISRSLGIYTINEFFSSQLAEQIFSKFGSPKLIIANNVMAHVPDLADFIKAVSILADSRTIVSVENPSLNNILSFMQFDTIYHEHYSYLSAYSVSRLSRMMGLQLFDVESLSIHGGSNRYWLRKFDEVGFVEESVATVINLEKHLGLFEKTTWIDYSTRVASVLRDFSNWLDTCKLEGRRVFGYGAAAKASTLLNSIRIIPDSILGIADGSYEKQGRFMPSEGIRIISPEQLQSLNPTDILIFPWNLAKEISIEISEILGNQVRTWIAIPRLSEL